MTITQTFDKQTLVDLIVTAIEGGSTDWYMLDDVDFPTSVDNKLCFSEKIGHAIWDNPEWSMPVYDVEYAGDDYSDLGEPLGILSYASCQKAFDLLAKDYPDVLARIVSEDSDALDADVFFQLAVMGEVVYG